ncbi:MAG: cyclic nucleotide-binding domain-containing protein [Bradyrhizobium sp.]|uniref:Crp/Fnr family transcriptional regulator n=1 Tax=Bradyrhizobium sp. TaxID=376 RepID=UPI00272214C7|nr:cyclic nucleotide-binding domain-containing protein [Bradyrhizobium sp.]MDO9564524.1 cyclic nucleotide-binding domain-containing protein [Bradyrhizobium sp.]MDP3690685.1 cyclic nucleotide-binding domain-containing protein [Bradyrhizobium sp.]
MSTTEMAGYVAALLVFLTFYMKTMVPLRLVGILSNCVFITYAYLANLHPVLVLHLILLPLNGLRLRQMLRLTRDVRDATQGNLNMDWLKPFTSMRRFKRGDVVFRKGDAADAMYFVVSGRFRLAELGKDMLLGHIVGELGLLAPDQLRTQTLECVEDGEMLHVTYEQVKQLCYQNPQFGFYFLQLTTRRLFENISKLERDAAAYRIAASSQA